MPEILTSAQEKVQFLLPSQFSQPDKNRVDAAVSQVNLSFVNWTDVQSVLHDVKPDKAALSPFLDKAYEIKSNAGMEVDPDIVENTALGLWAISITKLPDINFEQQMLPGSNGQKMQSELRERKPKLPELMGVMKKEKVNLPNAAVLWWAKKS